MAGGGGFLKGARTVSVSGGGGVSNALSGEDLSGRDLRKLRLTKAVMVRVGLGFWGALVVVVAFAVALGHLAPPPLFLFRSLFSHAPRSLFPFATRKKKKRARKPKTPKNKKTTAQGQL